MNVLRYSGIIGSFLLLVGCSSSTVTEANPSGGTGAAQGGSSSTTVTRPAGASSIAGTSTAGAQSTSGGASASGAGATAFGGATVGTPSGGAGAAGGSMPGGGGTAPGSVPVVGGAASSGGSSSGGLPAGGVATGGASKSAVAEGGSAIGGTNTSGKASGGTAAGGVSTSAVATGGAATGGFVTNIATGGAATGGAATGGAATGGAATGGAATGGAATGGAPNWCQTQSLPANVVAADFQCIDFDKGMPSTSTWAQTLTSGGTVALSTARASSAPNSLTCSVKDAADYTTAGAATLNWSNVGSNPVATVSVAASLSPVTQSGVYPAWTGAVSLMCVSFGSGQACLEYTYSSDSVAFQTAAYTGYLIDWVYVGGAARRDQCKVTGSLTTNIWTRVELRVTESTSVVEVLFGGTSVGTCTAMFGADTNFQVSVGPKVSASTSYTYTMNYDNVLAAATRSP